MCREQKTIKYLQFFLLVLVSFLIIIVAGFYTHITIGNSSYLHTADDHMITQRVAYNYNRYGKPFFNPAEAIAANTSLYWPIILSPIYLIAGLTSAIKILVLGSALTTAVTIVAATLILRDFRTRLYLVLFLSFSPTFLRYGATGWEHIPQALLITIAFVCIIFSSRKMNAFNVPPLSVLLVSVSFMIRPDSAVTVAGVVAGYVFSKDRYKLVRTYLFLSLLALIPISYISSMLFFYRDVVPNTAHLKHLGFYDSLISGARYFFNPHKAGLVPLLVVFLWALRQILSPSEKFILVSATGHVLFVAAVGGDVFAQGRFFLIYLPILASLSTKIIQKLVAPPKQVLGGLKNPVGIIMVVILAAWQSPYLYLSIRNGRYYYGNEKAVVQQLRIVNKINCVLRPSDGSIGLHYLGIGYWMPDFHIVDFLGKADPHIAKLSARYGPIGHNKWDYAYAFDRYRIAAVPISAEVVNTVVEPNFVLRKKNFMFWEVGAQFILEHGGYTFIPPQKFGNENNGFGLFVRDDLVDRFSHICRSG